MSWWSSLNSSGWRQLQCTGACWIAGSTVWRKLAMWCHIGDWLNAGHRSAERNMSVRISCLGARVVRGFARRQPWTILVGAPCSPALKPFLPLDRRRHRFTAVSRVCRFSRALKERAVGRARGWRITAVVGVDRSSIVNQTTVIVPTDQSLQWTAVLFVNVTSLRPYTRKSARGEGNNYW